MEVERTSRAAHTATKKTRGLPTIDGNERRSRLKSNNKNNKNNNGDDTNAEDEDGGKKRH